MTTSETRRNWGSLSIDRGAELKIVIQMASSEVADHIEEMLAVDKNVERVSSIAKCSSRVLNHVDFRKNEKADLSGA